MTYSGLKLCCQIFLLLSFQLSCGQIDNPCVDRIDYSQNDVNDGIDLDVLFADPTKEELDAVMARWNTFDMSSKHIEVIEEFISTKKRQVKVLVHEAERRNHYGGIILPADFDSTKTYPLMVWADGLSQENPLVDLENGYGFGFSNLLPDHFVLIPSFRGQSLQTSNDIYCSDGFFGDAYDGATDDALRFLQVSIDLFDDAIDGERISIYGGSRGGTVALLAGIRHPVITKVVSQSGPTQFHHIFCYDRYGEQFKYQFLNTPQPISDIRMKMLACSPFYFIDNYPHKLFIVHGRHDSIVPLWNATNIIENWAGQELKTLLTDDGHSVGAARMVAKWLKE